MHRILIVDDHIYIRKAIRRLLEENAFEVCGEAADGLEAIKLSQKLHPDLILLDLSMPVMNGLDAAREISKLMPEVPLLMATNHAMALEESETRKTGIRLVLAKDECYRRLIPCAREALA